MIRQLRALLVSLIFLSVCSLGFAQNAQIQGEVSDGSGAVIPKASVRVVNQLTGTERKVATNGSGQYTVPGLDPSVYKIFVQAPGFSTAVSTPITLSVAQNAVLNFKMRVGDAGQTVTVDGSGLQINTTDASVSTVIDRDFVENMPLNGRSFQELLTLAPGVSQVSTSAGYGYGVGYSGDIVVNGQRTESNYFTVDGVNANTGVVTGGNGAGAGVSGSVPSFTALGTTQGLISIDALSEFRSTTSTYSAEYGRSPGGQFSFSSRSGTDKLHGSLYNYFRNDALDANNWFNDYYADPKGKERQNDFGGTLGGPIVWPHFYDGRNNTFFFLSYEGLRLSSPQAATQVLVPEADLRQNSPAALQPLLDAFPIANGASDGLDDGFGYYIQTVSYPSTLDSTSIRIDHSAGEKLTLFGRYADTPSSTASYSGSVEQPSKNRTQSATLGSTYSFSDRQSNEFRFNFTRTSGYSANISTDLGGATPFNLSSLPGPNGGPFPQTNSNLYVVFEFADFTDINLQNYPVTQRAFNVTDTHTWSRGRHNLKLGIDWRIIRTTLYTETPIEEIGFADESEVLGNSPSLAYVKTNGNASDNEPIYRTFSSFIQDEWKANQHLSISTGLRWDIDPAPVNANGPVPYTITQVTDLATTTLAPRGTPLWHTDWLGFAPRLGVAYQTKASSERNTVLRAGFGVFYDTGSTSGSLGYNGIGFTSESSITSASFPLTSSQLILPPPDTSTPYAGTIIGFDPQLKLPYSYQYNIAVEQAVSKQDSLTIGYVGSAAHRLLTTFEASPAAIGNANFSPSATLIVTRGGASSSYNSLQVKYQRDLHHNLQALVSYTLSHSIDNASSNFTLFQLLRASSDFDTRHNLQAAVTYLPPRLGNSRASELLTSGWGADLRFQARTATPVNVIGSETISPSTGTFLESQPNRVLGQSVYLYGNQYPGGRVLNYDAFQPAPAGVQGDVPRNSASGFNVVQLDTALRRNIPIRDHLALQLRAEAFNIFNHPMFGPVYNSLSYGPALFGYAFNTLNTVGNLNSLYQVGGPRSLQLSAKLSF